MKQLLIEGWRGVNHSYALVNQFQILELLRHSDLKLYHHDLPFIMPHWNAKTHAAGFPAADQALIASLAPLPPGVAADCTYRIVAPTPVPSHTPGQPGKTITFMVTEMGLSAKSFADPSARCQQYTQGDDCVVTPTRWSRERLLEHGFDADKVHVVRHGVRADVFRPMTAEQRQQARHQLGLRDDEFVILNLGAAFWNKGVDVLLLAFARLRQTHGHVRLLLKDQRGLYGVSIDQTVHELARAHPQLFTEATLQSLTLIDANLDQQQLRAMYCVADCYASTYRAEGFNLPVLEALACHTPVVVTEGGATDDFCSDEVSLKIRSTPGVHDRAGEGQGRFREPDPDATLEALDACVRGQGVARPQFQQAIAELLPRFSWAAAVAELKTLI